MSALAAEPDWTKLEEYQGTMQRAEFLLLLETVYAPGGAWKSTIRMAEDGAHVLTTGTNQWVLRFADGQSAKEPPRYWKPLATLPAAARPLEGVKIALDPGHLGAEWAKMEERWFQVGAGTVPVAEGDMTLLTSRLLGEKLRAKGAEVVFVRNEPGPLTKLRPEDLREAAREQLKRQGLAFIRGQVRGPGRPAENELGAMDERVALLPDGGDPGAGAAGERQLKPDLSTLPSLQCGRLGRPEVSAIGAEEPHARDGQRMLQRGGVRIGGCKILDAGEAAFALLR